MKIIYKPWDPRPSTVVLIEAVNHIINEYQQDGYTLTLRQLYYQFVARDIIENSERSYKNLGAVVTKGRMAGMISWLAIEDRSRKCESFWYDENILSPVRSLPNYIRFDRWARQRHYVEVWVEKEALGNVVSRACEPVFVPHLSCKGYLSASEAWRSGQRFKEQLDNGKTCILIHLGDHDPSGIDMTRDNRERLDVFTRVPLGVTVVRLALNMDQVEEFSSPPNPTKVTDSRAGGYIKRFGRLSWELDALEPRVLEELIQDEVDRYIDPDAWLATEGEEESVRKILRMVYERWDLVQGMIMK